MILAAVKLEDPIPTRWESALQKILESCLPSCRVSVLHSGSCLALGNERWFSFRRSEDGEGIHISFEGIIDVTTQRAYFDNLLTSSISLRKLTGLEDLEVAFPESLGQHVEVQRYRVWISNREIDSIGYVLLALNRNVCPHEDIEIGDSSPLLNVPLKVPIQIFTYVEEETVDLLSTNSKFPIRTRKSLLLRCGGDEVLADAKIVGGRMEIVKSKNEEIDQGEEENLSLGIEIGGVAMTLKDILSLRRGASLSFSLPRKIQVGLSIAGARFGRGELEVSEETTTLSIIEIFSLTDAIERKLS